MPLALFVISLVFSALITILYFVQVLMRFQPGLLGSAPPKPEHLCHGKPQIDNMSAAHANLSTIFFQSIIHDLRKVLKRMNDRRHPRLTQAVVLNHSPVLPFIWTALVCLVVRTRFALTLHFRTTYMYMAYKAACHTLSKCF